MVSCLGFWRVPVASAPGRCGGTRRLCACARAGGACHPPGLGEAECSPAGRRAARRAKPLVELHPTAQLSGLSAALDAALDAVAPCYPLFSSGANPCPRWIIILSRNQGLAGTTAAQRPRRCGVGRRSRPGSGGMAPPAARVLVWAACIAAAEAKGGGGQPVAVTRVIEEDTRKMCDPCTELWAERDESRTYSEMHLRQAPHYSNGAEMEYVNFYGQAESFDDGYTAGTEVCADLSTSTGQKEQFQLPCTPSPMDEANGELPTADTPLYCPAGDPGGTVTVTCATADPGDGSLVPQQPRGMAPMKALPCTSLYTSQNGYTPIQACCRCGGGTYEPSRSSIPPPPAPPLVSAEDKCLAMPGCCYSATETCAASSGNDWWDNGERGYNGVRENRPDLPGCCFSPEWRDALSDVATPSDLVQARFSGTADGPDDYPSATCTDSDSWPEFTRSSEPSQFWMRQDGDSDAIPGVNLVFCKTQGTPPSHGPGWRWMAPAAGGGLWVLWFLYQCIGQPITGSVYLCCMDKKREGKEPDCPKAAAIIIGGTCLCCAPCICGMICAGALPPPRVCARTSVAGSHSDCSRLSC
jgi:hypothetical protein